MLWTFLLISICATISLSMALAFCLCWKRKTHKNDLLGLDGMVTQKNPDENVNHLPSAAAAPCVIDVHNSASTVAPNSVVVAANSAIAVDHTDSAKRNPVATNTRRSLPDIPAEQETAINWEPTGDNSSEHYATVGQYRNAKRTTVSNGVEARPSISQHSSISQADDAFSPYEKVKYDKIKSKEHSYAQLQPTTSRQVVVEEGNLGSADDRNNYLRPEAPGTSSEPLAPPRSRRSSTHSGIGGGIIDIPAASAVAGGIAASPDLPYMTPPVVNQSNFSGDSQDSSKGYTSISVREPLANIMAQTKEMSKKRDLDPHYSTVSDDSDDVYTTIPDPNNQIYTSESETYARIPAHPITIEADVIVEANPHHRSQDDELEIDELYEPPPQTPLLSNLKQQQGSTGHSHSRQASSSSSIAAIGSPKPEKRQANSPLPPPPMASTSFDFYADPNKVPRNLDDLYAKVQKTKKDDDLTETPEQTPEKNRSDNLNRKSTSSNVSLEIDPSKKRIREHNYETLKKPGKDNKKIVDDPDYEKIQNCEEPGYASINGPESLSSSDPGYEVLKQRPAPLSEIDPNYEELKDSTYTKIKYLSAGGGSKDDGYSVVNKVRKNNGDDKSRSSTNTNTSNNNSQDLSMDEPNYESMPSESLSSEPNYAALKSTTTSESDPNYESVNNNRQSDPNYESVRDLELEPPYERLNDDNLSIADSGGYKKVSSRRGYENIDTSESSNGQSSVNSDKRDLEPAYEKLNDIVDCDLLLTTSENGKKLSNNNSASSNELSNEPNYSTINNIRKEINNSNSMASEEDDGIVQV